MRAPLAALASPTRLVATGALVGVLAGVLASTGCGHPTNPEPPPSVAGTYALRSINGGAAPWLIGHVGAERLERVSQTLTLNPDSTLTQVIAIRRTLSSGVTLDSTWTYTGGWSLAYPNITLNIGPYSTAGWYGVFDRPEGGLTMGIVAPLLVFRREP